MSANTAFAADDHRAFNRNGEAFDKGETFSGVPYDVALEVVEDIRKLVPANATMAEFALRWILMEDAVSTVIPGARNAAQAQANSRASALPALPRKRWMRCEKSTASASRNTCITAGKNLQPGSNNASKIH
jgi:aryl-alcohol dehydrogenase-like predicted oxidoreductase